MSLKVNGKAYDWGDVDIKLPGLALQVQEISYDDEQEMEETYGKGSKPRGFGTGNYKASGKMSLLRDDYDRYVKTAAKVGITKASKVFMLDAVVDEDKERLTADMEEYPGVSISIGNKLTEILGLTDGVNLKKL